MNPEKKLEGGSFAFGIPKSDPSVCIQLGTHGSLTQAEIDNHKLGGPQFYAPGTCPADYKFLRYGVHVLGKTP
eukprot:CAMPEP_0184325066 /NCGR_PEP_ID=MMETSP1049-20130417/138424_1 /TAXON_ID=77928 /ORGANISM="Proteomonas sulcata, Strain CCMP704" /LENGTH=72 /DNA_ID=CAMNT_0026647021 /DNA_START=50 /DNA_END=269 /DNA_ORIENTATION=+